MKKRQKKYSGNPIIREGFSADPCVLVSDDCVYLYTGHDDPPPGVDDYVMRDWRCFSSRDLLQWTAHPTPLRVSDFAWAAGDAFASCVVKKGAKYFWYAAVTHGAVGHGPIGPAAVPGKAIAVAVADAPAGPFTDAIGAALIDKTMLPGADQPMGNMDPSVLIDDDGHAHLFWGFGTCYCCRLGGDMVSLAGEIKKVDLPGFKEGILIYKRAGWYYLCYGSGIPEKVLYAISRQVDGPWEPRGVLNEVPQNCETNRPALLDFQGRSFFLYHNGALPGGGSHRRSVCIEEIHYNPDGSIRPVQMSMQGVAGVPAVY